MDKKNMLGYCRDLKKKTTQLVLSFVESGRGLETTKRRRAKTERQTGKKRKEQEETEIKRERWNGKIVRWPDGRIYYEEKTRK